MSIVKKAFDSNYRTEYLLPGLPIGAVGALSSVPRNIKKTWALEAAIAVATGGEDDMLCLRPMSSGKVVYFSYPHHEVALIRQLRGIYSGSTPSSRLFENLVIIPPGKFLLDISNNFKLEKLAGLCNGARLIVLDGIEWMYRSGNIRHLESALLHLAYETCASVLVLHIGVEMEENTAWVGSLDTLVSKEEHERVLAASGSSYKKLARLTIMRTEHDEAHRTFCWYGLSDTGAMHYVHSETY